jgi:fucose 4-O-acetylase-like acetyltransferase
MKQRILWIDELKGFAILLVIMGHVALHGLNISSDIDVLEKLIMSLQMPLFFFLSGIVINSIPSFAKLFNKLFQFLFPCLIIGILFAYFIGLDYNAFFLAGKKLGYWYLFVLAEYYFIYYMIGGGRYESHKLVLYIIIPFIIWILLKFSVKIIPSKYSALFCLSECCEFWPFFILGVVCRKLKLLDIIEKQKWFTSVLLVYFIITFVLFEIKGFNIHIFVLTSLAIVLFIVIVYKNSRLKYNVKIIGQLANFGRNSLDIYIYHYFFLNNINITAFGKWLSITGNWFFELMFMIIVSVIIAYFAIFVGMIVRETLMSKIIYGQFVDFTKVMSKSC